MKTVVGYKAAVAYLAAREYPKNWISPRMQMVIDLFGVTVERFQDDHERIFKRMDRDHFREHGKSRELL